MARRLVIAVDCDDVLLATTPFFVDAYNALHGTAVQLAGAHSSDQEVWQADRPLLEERLSQLMNTDDYRLLKPTADTIEVLKSLAKDHELHVVTARREHERALTQLMLDTHLHGVFTSLELVGWIGSKGEVCQRIGADVLIDDSARHLHNAIELGLPKQGALLFGDYPWNTTDSSHDDLTQCLDWASVKVAIDAIAQEQVSIRESK